MTGSSLVPIVVPIVTTLALAVWLGIVFYAAGHPAWKAHTAPAARVTRVTRTADAEKHPETPGQAQPEQAPTLPPRRAA